MNRKCYILMNADGLEKKASALSALDIYKAIKDYHNPVLLKLNKNKWIRQIERIESGSICMLATHGSFGEDGSLQKMLEIKKIMHTHSSAIVCGILLNKHLSKIFYQSLNIHTPCWYFKGNKYGKSNTKNVIEWVKKPVFGGSNIDIEKVNNISTSNSDSKYIYEEYIKGAIQISVGILGSNRNIIILNPIIRQRPLFSVGNIDIKNININKIVKNCNDLAKRIHVSLGCQGITKTDFLLDNKNKIWVIETDAIPGLSKNNAVSMAANMYGLEYGELINKILEDAYIE